ncbi:MAG: PAS domain S-box protein, partial [Nitrospinaceae bacterium]|nr:PAS domain-containing protein [Nitrospinaceae bacterium]NIR54134.1 PAS domain-containing protein [Nitrospinaceae bacterium]NIS84548.1 PAS domain-containing protein [Nitrospinaceae bacterium]NIT80513.1 PAS domain-containing protein [Nitrospinaceae bacterium]NIU43627.1 PAS domain-containing protein [Nitrospinaceae bacterium]
MTVIINDNENPFFGALRNLPVPFSAFDPNYRVVFWNRGCERITGYSAQDIVENPKAWEILFPDRDHRRRMFMEWIDRKNDYQDWEWDVTCKDGSV